MTSCSKNENKTATMNPFFEAYHTRFEVPPFDKIYNKHYLPAFEEGIKQHNLEIEKICENKDSASFANTIEVLDYSGDLLDRVNKVFSNLKDANTNDSIQAVAQKIAPMLSQHEDAINLT